VTAIRWRPPGTETRSARRNALTLENATAFLDLSAVDGDRADGALTLTRLVPGVQFT
jgi:hypothetical protein